MNVAEIFLDWVKEVNLTQLFKIWMTVCYWFWTTQQVLILTLVNMMLLVVIKHVLVVIWRQNNFVHLEKNALSTGWCQRDQRLKIPQFLFTDKLKCNFFLPCRCLATKSTFFFFFFSSWKNFYARNKLKPFNCIPSPSIV